MKKLSVKKQRELEVNAHVCEGDATLEAMIADGTLIRGPDGLRAKMPDSVAILKMLEPHFERRPPITKGEIVTLIVKEGFIASDVLADLWIDLMFADGVLSHNPAVRGSNEAA